MNELALEVGKLAESAWIAVSNFASIWILYQALVIGTCYAAGLGVKALATQPLEARIRRIVSQPRLLRVLAILLRRVDWIVFAALLWGCVLVLRSVTWPSNSYFVAIAASLATTWVVVSVLSRTIRKRSLAGLVEVGAWSVAALYILGWLGNAIAALEWAAISFGDVRISVLSVLKGLGAFAVLVWLGKVTGDWLEQRLRESHLLNASLHALFGKLAKVALVVVATILSFSAAGIDVTLLTVFSGALGLGLGFGLQKVAANLASGVIMLADRSIKPGDMIQMGNAYGWITQLRARYVSVVTSNGAEHLIPNELFINERVVNWSFSDRNVRLEVSFGVDYASDPHLVRKLVVEAIGKTPRVLRDPPPLCHMVGFGESSLDFVARFWINDPEEGTTNLRSAVFLAIWDVFKEHGISIPFPQRVVHMPAGAEPLADAGELAASLRAVVDAARDEERPALKERARTGS